MFSYCNCKQTGSCYRNRTYVDCEPAASDLHALAEIDFYLELKGTRIVNTAARSFSSLDVDNVDTLEPQHCL